MRRRGAPRAAWWLAGALFSLAGCSGYADFTLPALGPEGPLPEWSWEVLEEPVLPRGAPGEWDAVDALNPSVVLHGGIFYNLYSGYDGRTWHTGLAVSHDGIHWEKRGKVLSPDPDTWEGDYIAANGHLGMAGGEFYYWYQAGDPPRIGLARSRDAFKWEKLPEPVLGVGPRGAWDERGVGDPYVVEVGSRFYLYYLGQDRARRQRLGVAVSEDGVRWRKLRSNPVLELGPPGAFDEAGLGEPAVWAFGGRYWMLYTGRDRAERRRLGLAVSVDGVHWERASRGAALAGSEPWNAEVVCDATVLPAGGASFHVWFGGGDRPRPAENLNGAIGYALLRLSSASR